MARIEIAPGVQVRIIPAAISHPLDYMQRVEQAKREPAQQKRAPKK